MQSITSVLVGNRLRTTVEVTLLDGTPKTPETFTFTVLNYKTEATLTWTHPDTGPDVIPTEENAAMTYGDTDGEIVFEWDVDDPGNTWVRFDGTQPKVAIEQKVKVTSSKVLGGPI